MFVVGFYAYFGLYDIILPYRHMIQMICFEHILVIHLRVAIWYLRNTTCRLWMDLGRGHID